MNNNKPIIQNNRRQNQSANNTIGRTPNLTPATISSNIYGGGLVLFENYQIKIADLIKGVLPQKEAEHWTNQIKQKPRYHTEYCQTRLLIENLRAIKAQELPYSINIQQLLKDRQEAQ